MYLFSRLTTIILFLWCPSCLFSIEILRLDVSSFLCSLSLFIPFWFSLCLLFNHQISLYGYNEPYHSTPFKERKKKTNALFSPWPDMDKEEDGDREDKYIEFDSWTARRWIVKERKRVTKSNGRSNRSWRCKKMFCCRRRRIKQPQSSVFLNSIRDSRLAGEETK